MIALLIPPAICIAAAVAYWRSDGCNWKDSLLMGGAAGGFWGGCLSFLVWGLTA